MPESETAVSHALKCISPMADRWLKHCQRHAQKRAKFTAVALQLMVQKSICAWLVNEYAVNGSCITWDPPPVVVDLGSTRALPMIANICMILPVAVSGRNRVSHCMVVASLTTIVAEKLTHIYLFKIVSINAPALGTSADMCHNITVQPKVTLSQC